MILKSNPTVDWHKKRPYKELDHLSHSSVAQFLQCGLAWRLSHVDRLQLIEPIQSYFVFGTAFHNGLRPFWHGGEGQFKEKWKSYKHSKVTYKNTSWLQLYRQGVMMEAGVIARLQGKFDPKVTKTEMNDPVDLGFTKLERRIDVVTEVDRLRMTIDGREKKISGPLRIDVKSSAFAYNKAAIDQSQQLMTYQIPGPKLGREGYSAYLVATKSNRPVIQLIGKSFSREEIGRQLRRIKYVHDEIKRGSFVQHAGSHCDNCPFNKLCYEAPGWEKSYKHNDWHRPGTKSANSSSDKSDNKAAT